MVKKSKIYTLSMLFIALIVASATAYNFLTSSPLSGVETPLTLEKKRDHSVITEMPLTAHQDFDRTDSTSLAPDASTNTINQFNKSVKNRTKSDSHVYQNEIQISKTILPEHEHTVPNTSKINTHDSLIENNPVTDEVLIIQPTLKPEFWLWAGFGENYQYHKQSIPSVSGQSKFQNIQGPTLYVMAGLLGASTGAEFSYKETPGRMESSPKVTVLDGDFTWKTLTGEGLYKFVNSNSYLRFGFQHHSLPFMDLDTTNATLTVRANTLTMATIGYEHTYSISKKLRCEWLFRYQYPIQVGTSTGRDFSVKPEFAFDGSLGGVYKINDIVRVGLFWYGQWHQFKFDYTSNTSFMGKQTLFYSNFDFRVGWEF